MTAQYRDSLIEHLIETQPELRAFIHDMPTDFTAGSWNLVSYSFQRGFEAFWDLARSDRSGLMHRPLLVLCRQSIELTIKSTLVEIAAHVKNTHDLKKLFEELLRLRAEAGYDDDNDHTRNVKAMIDEIQSFDPLADRFRYPVKKDGQLYLGFDINLDEIFQAHWIITTWCEGAAMEIKGYI